MSKPLNDPVDILETAAQQFGVKLEHVVVERDCVRVKTEGGHQWVAYTTGMLPHQLRRAFIWWLTYGPDGPKTVQ